MRRPWAQPNIRAVRQAFPHEDSNEGSCVRVFFAPTVCVARNSGNPRKKPSSALHDDGLESSKNPLEKIDVDRFDHDKIETPLLRAAAGFLLPVITQGNEKRPFRL